MKFNWTTEVLYKLQQLWPFCLWFRVSFLEQSKKEHRPYHSYGLHDTSGLNLALFCFWCGNFQLRGVKCLAAQLGVTQFGLSFTKSPIVFSVSISYERNLMESKGLICDQIFWCGTFWWSNSTWKSVFFRYIIIFMATVFFIVRYELQSSDQNLVVSALSSTNFPVLQISRS